MAAQANANETSLYLLNPPIPENPFRKQLWGSLVTNPFKPKDGFSSWNRKAPSEMVKGLDVVPEPIQDYGEVLSWAREGSAEVKVESVLKAYLESFESEVDFRKATHAEWYDMTAPQGQLELLLTNPDWVADALAFIKAHEGDQLFFVTAMLVVAKLDVGRAHQSRDAAGLKASVPNPKTGSNLITAGGGGGTSQQRVVAGRFVNPQVLAIGYRPVKITTEVPEKRRGTVGAWCRRIFGGKSKHKLVGQLYNDDKNLIYKLNMGQRMVRGNVHFMGGEPSGDEDEEEKTSRTITHDDVMQGPPGGDGPGSSAPSTIRRIVIRSGNAPED